MLPRRAAEPISCRCGNVVAWWTNGRRGEALYHARHQVDAFGVGFNNGFWLPAIDASQRPRTPGGWRELHEASCRAPGYMFDESARNCWVVLFKPGTVSGVDWADDEQGHSMRALLR